LAAVLTLLLYPALGLGGTTPKPSGKGWAPDLTKQLSLVAGRMSQTVNEAEKMEAGEKPITKVIRLLKEMQDELEAEAKEDEEMYEKLACWCDTYGKEKSEAVDIARQQIDSLQNEIEGLVASVSSLGVDIEDLQTDIAKNIDALAKATAIRQKEYNEFNVNEKDLITAIGQLKGAIVALSKHHPESMIQANPELQLMQPVLRRLVHQRAALLKNTLLPGQRRELTKFLDAQEEIWDSPEDDVDGSSEPGLSFMQQRVPGFKSYAPQSGQIFGILKQMKETFEGDMSEAQKEEMDKVAQFTSMKTAKEEEIASQEQMLEERKAQLADAKEKLAMKKRDMKDTRAALSADVAFLMDLKEKCVQGDAQWEQRRKTRMEEIKAVSDTIAILENDNLRDAQKNVVRGGGGASFLQMGSKERKVADARSRASHLLRAAAAKSADPSHRLALVASQVESSLDAFTKVKKVIDELIEKLAQEQKDEVAKKDFCVEEIDANERETDHKTRDRDELDQKITDLTATIDELTKGIQELQNEIVEMQSELMRASADRIAENKEFQKTIDDQVSTQEILKKAYNRLAQFYHKKTDSAAALLQRQPTPGADAPPPPPGFKGYTKSNKSSGVMGMIMDLIGEAKQMEVEALADENSAQGAYEDLVSETNKSVKAKSKEVTDKTEMRAKKDAERIEAKEAMKTLLSDLEALADTNVSLHEECDFLLKNFDVRQKARAGEIDALRQAKAILSGAQL